MKPYFPPATRPFAYFAYELHSIIKTNVRVPRPKTWWQPCKTSFFFRKEFTFLKLNTWLCKDSDFSCHMQWVLFVQKKRHPRSPPRSESNLESLTGDTEVDELGAQRRIVSTCRGLRRAPTTSQKAIWIPVINQNVTSDIIIIRQPSPYKQRTLPSN